MFYNKKKKLISPPSHYLSHSCSQGTKLNCSLCVCVWLHWQYILMIESKRLYTTFFCIDASYPSFCVSLWTKCIEKEKKWKSANHIIAFQTLCLLLVYLYFPHTNFRHFSYVCRLCTWEYIRKVFFTYICTAHTHSECKKKNILFI